MHSQEYADFNQNERGPYASISVTLFNEEYYHQCYDKKHTRKVDHNGQIFRVVERFNFDFSCQEGQHQTCYVDDDFEAKGQRDVDDVLK